MYTTDDIIKLFTDAFDTSEDSNLYKLLEVCADELELIRETNMLTLAWRDIDEAEGLALDVIGENINQPRGQAVDEIYRILLKSKIARNLSDGTIDTIINVLAIALSADAREIKIEEGWERDPNSRPSVNLTGLPLARLLESGMDPINFLAILQKTVAAGVRVDSVELAGTFTFGDANASTNIDTEKGFGDAENPEIGGYLGVIYSSDDMPKLPI